MNFSCGDDVVHPKFGVGTVVCIEEMVFSGDGPSVFYRVDFGKTTLWIPVKIPKSRGIRPVTHKRDLARYRSVLKSQPVHLNDNFRKRQVELEDRMDAGTFQSLCEVVRDLSARNREKILSNYELTLLRRTREAMDSEWARASNLPLVDAADEIDALLRKGRQP
ncbi:MAG TPA: hypothetical protein VIK64_12235 [Anaerolineales bacterium]